MARATLFVLAIVLRVSALFRHLFRGNESSSFHSLKKDFFKEMKAPLRRCVGRSSGECGTDCCIGGVHVRHVDVVSRGVRAARVQRNIILRDVIRVQHGKCVNFPTCILWVSPIRE